MASDPTNSVPSATALSEQQAFGNFWDNHKPFTAPQIIDGEERNPAVDDCLYAHAHGWDARQPEIDALRERERRLRETLADAESWVTDLKMRRVVAELLAAKEGV